MSTDLHRMTEAIREMEDSIRRIESRLSHVEHELFDTQDAAAYTTAGEELPLKSPPATIPPPSLPGSIKRQSLVSLIGRSLIVIGGAYLLRALTESGAFPIMVGAVAGLVYAAAFIVRAHAQAESARVSATFHGVTGILIAMPLAVETAVRFRELRVALAFIIVLAFAGTTAAIAARAKLRQLAWIVQAVTIASLIALIVGSRSFHLGMWSLLVAAVGSMILADRLESRWFIILPAFFTNLLVLPIANLAIVGRAPAEGTSAIVTLLGYAAVWIAIVMVDARRHPDRPGAIFLLHLAAVMLLGVGGSMFVAARLSLAFLFAPICSVIAVATGIYASRMVIDAGDRDRRSVTFVTLTSLLIMAVTGAVLGPTINSVVWLVLAAVAFLLARTGHRLLYESSTLLLVGATWGSGLLRWIGEALVSVPDPARPLPSAAAVAVLGVSLLFLLTAHPPTGTKVFHRWVINAATTMIIVGGSFAIGIHLLQLSLPMMGVEVEDAGAVASARTIILSVGAIALAWLARYPRSRTIGSLVNIVLILAAVLIVLVNVRVGRAATHFPAFSAYGIALIVAPTLKRKSLTIRHEHEVGPASGPMSPGVPAQ